MLSTCPILLEELWRDSPVARLSDVFDDGHVLYDAVIEHGLEGIVTPEPQHSRRQTATP